MTDRHTKLDFADFLCHLTDNVYPHAEKLVLVTDNLNIHSFACLYERFAPQGPGGTLDRRRGVRQFVVGTGGRSLRRFGPPQPNSEVRGNTAHGVLHLRLRDGSYGWRFVAEPGKSFADSGTDRCH